MLTITDSTEQFTLASNETICLELKLNVTSRGRELSHIGDVLFDYAKKDNLPETLVLTPEQYKFLLLLLSMDSYKECYQF